VHCFGIYSFPAFNLLFQIVLLKACTIEVMLLRAAKQYQRTSKAINFLNGKFYNKNSFYRAGMWAA